MAVETRYAVLREIGLVFIQRVGDFVPGDFSAFMRGFIESRDFRQGLNFLIDQRRLAYPLVRYEDVTALSGAWAAMNPILGHCRMAFVHESDAHFGTGRMNASVLENDEVERRPFRSTEAALRWLGLPADTPLPELFPALVPGARGAGR